VLCCAVLCCAASSRQAHHWQCCALCGRPQRTIAYPCCEAGPAAPGQGVSPAGISWVCHRWRAVWAWPRLLLVCSCHLDGLHLELGLISADVTALLLLLQVAPWLASRCCGWRPLPTCCCCTCSLLSRRCCSVLPRCVCAAPPPRSSQRATPAQWCSYCQSYGTQVALGRACVLQCGRGHAIAMGYWPRAMLHPVSMHSRDITPCLACTI
jgi:hypothetical protein